MAGSEADAMPAPLHRTTIALLVPLVVAGVLLSSSVAEASAASEASTFEARINAERQAAGLPGYAVAADLQALACRHAQRMADRHDYFHNPNLGSEVGGWSMLGENVGFGPTVDDLHRALMASPSHRANILRRDFTQVGVGTVRGTDGQLYVVQVFRLPSSAAPAPVAPAPAQPTARALPPAPTPTTAPPPPPPTTTTTAPPPPPTTTTTAVPVPEPTIANISATGAAPADPAVLTASAPPTARSVSVPAAVATTLISLVLSAQITWRRRLRTV